jgi:hypothetical protein
MLKKEGLEGLLGKTPSPAWHLAAPVRSTAQGRAMSLHFFIQFSRNVFTVVYATDVILDKQKDAISKKNHVGIVSRRFFLANGVCDGLHT